MPALSEGEADPDKKGFETQDEAWEWAESHYCDVCKKALEAGDDMIGCEAEWVIEPEGTDNG